MITFIFSIVALLTSYFIYGKVVERIFGVDANAITPAYRLQDGVDFVPMKLWKIFLIQFLNIAGLGPIFGAIAGAMWGPVAFVWIVFGCIFGGAVHDYFSGMISIRENGKSIPEIVGHYLGNNVKHAMRFFTIALMIVVGAVFIVGPAKILQGLTGDFATMSFWVSIVFIYYILATLLPIDKIIGKIYPIFGFALLFMALSLLFSLFYYDFTIPELTISSFRNMHIKGDAMPIFPMMFVSIACGAISGFHATQSPLMARCMKNEMSGKKVFYGAMITEGIVALIWAAIAMSFFGGVNELNQVMISQNGNAAWIVNTISNTALGKFGAVLAILGVVAAPITSGDTAFRSARLIIADFLQYNQTRIINRLYITIPLFVIGFILTQIDFSIIWRYMAWANQTLAVVVLWTITSYLILNKKFFWITLIPAVFMTAVCSVYILVAPEGLQLSYVLGYSLGTIITILVSISFFMYMKRRMKM